MSDFRYPVGQLSLKPELQEDERAALVQQITEAPAKLRAAVGGLSDSQLDMPYRPGGWTVRQVAHHLADSHLNAYIRFKLAMTETTPTIKTYEENVWAELFDARTLPLEPSLLLLEALHTRWVAFLRSLAPSDFARQAIHPQNGAMNLDRFLQIYAWHGRHHVAHITCLRERSGW